VQFDVTDAGLASPGWRGCGPGEGRCARSLTWPGSPRRSGEEWGTGTRYWREKPHRNRAEQKCLHGMAGRGCPGHRGGVRVLVGGHLADGTDGPGHRRRPRRPRLTRVLGRLDGVIEKEWQKTWQEYRRRIGDAQRCCRRRADTPGEAKGARIVSSVAGPIATPLGRRAEGRAARSSGTYGGKLSCRSPATGTMVGPPTRSRLASDKGSYITGTTHAAPPPLVDGWDRGGDPAGLRGVET